MGLVIIGQNNNGLYLIAPCSNDETGFKAIPFENAYFDKSKKEEFSYVEQFLTVTKFEEYLVSNYEGLVTICKYFAFNTIMVSLITTSTRDISIGVPKRVRLNLHTKSFDIATRIVRIFNKEFPTEITDIGTDLNALLLYNDDSARLISTLVMRPMERNINGLINEFGKRILSGGTIVIGDTTFFFTY